MKYLITGGCGFMGSNLGAEVLNRGEELVVLDNLSREGSNQNLNWLKNQGNFKFYPYDISNTNDVSTLIKNIKPDVVFHLAGQVAMSTSIKNPRLDFKTNAFGTFNLLDSIRKHSPESIVLFSSTNKVYGDFEDLKFEELKTRYVCNQYPNGFDENISLNFHSPYGCSKGTADQYMLDFYRIYGVRTTVFRHSSMYGDNQHPTFDQGWIGWFCQKAVEIENRTETAPFTIAGSGKQVRDVLHSSDVINLYFNTVEKIEETKGSAFNVGGGMENSLSLIELFALLEENLGIKMVYEKTPWRESDQKIFVADNSKINEYIGWKPVINKNEGLVRMINWIKENNNGRFNI